MQSRYYRTRPAHAPNGPESPELVTAVQSLGDLVLSWNMPLIVTGNPPVTLHGSPDVLPSSTTIINPQTFSLHYSRAVLVGDNATFPGSDPSVLTAAGGQGAAFDVVIAPGPFNPANVTSAALLYDFNGALGAWQDIGRTVPAADGHLVASWVDQVAGVIFSERAPDKGPLYQALPHQKFAMSFNGIDQGLSQTNFVLPALFSIVLVAIGPAGLPTPMQVLVMDDNAVFRMIQLLYDVGPSMKFEGFNNANTGFDPNAPIAAFTLEKVFTVIRDTALLSLTSSTIAAVTTATTGTAQGPSNNAMDMGWWHLLGGVQFLQGHLIRVLFYDGALSSGDALYLQKGLNTLYGLT